MPYRLVALDVDGTIATGGQMPSQVVRDAVAAAQARGVHVVLATGRPYHSARPYAEALGLQTPLICFQGAVIYEAGSGPGDIAGRANDAAGQGLVQGVLLTEGLPNGALQDVIRFAEQRELEFSVYTPEALYLQRMRHSRAFYDRWFGLPVCIVSDLEAAVRDLIAKQVTILKGLFIGEPDANEELIHNLQDRYAAELNVIRSHSLFVEIVSPAVSKGRAVAFLAERLGIAQAETMAVGDSGNDRSMIAWAGLGVAVRNATPDVLEIADWVAPSVTEDGAAAAIDRFITRNGPS